MADTITKRVPVRTPSIGLKIFLIVVLALAVTFVAAVVYGAYRLRAGTRELRAHLEAARVPIRPQVVGFRELEGLPVPVQRFFRNVLKDGQPMVAGVSVRHSGTFNMGETADQWKPFTSNQRVVTQRPGFDWDGRVMMIPGLQVRVHDAYVASEGILHATLLGLFSLVNLHGTGGVAEGELMRFFAEAAWYPTALLPSQGVRWEAVDDRSARGTLNRWHHRRDNALHLQRAGADRHRACRRARTHTGAGASPKSPTTSRGDRGSRSTGACASVRAASQPVAADGLLRGPPLNRYVRHPEAGCLQSRGGRARKVPAATG